MTHLVLIYTFQHRIMAFSSLLSSPTPVPYQLSLHHQLPTTHLLSCLLSIHFGNHLTHSHAEPYCPPSSSRLNFLSHRHGRLSKEVFSHSSAPALSSTGVEIPPIRKSLFQLNAGLDLSYELEGGFSPFILPLPPGPVQFPRKKLDRKFAVLLMRSAYEAVDALDFIPMDKFQIKFWKLRQSEVEPYTMQYSPLKVKYGDLTDPLYFDFISFAQFATISNEMMTGKLVFQERIGDEGKFQTVLRDDSLRDNSLLPSAFNEKAGNIIYQRLLEGFEGEVFDAPRPCLFTSDLKCLVEGVKKLTQLFANQGYCLSAQVEEVRGEKNTKGLKLRIRTQGVATLWGMRTLASRGALVLSDFDALVIKSFLKESLCNASYKVRLTDTYKEEVWTLVKINREGTPASLSVLNEQNSL